VIALERLEQRQPLVGQRALLGREHVQHDDVVAQRAQPAQRGQRAIVGVEQVRGQHHQRAPPPGQLADPIERVGRRGVAGAGVGDRGVEHRQHVGQVVALGARRHVQRRRSRAERVEADLVLLLADQVRQRGQRQPAVLDLADPGAGEAHRRRRVEHQVRGELRLLLELLHVVAIELGQRLPVDVAQLVARRVLLVLGELDRRAVQPGAVHARPGRCRRSPGP
jgi:hypothetical protein